MGGRGSGGHNKKTIEQHIKEGTYRAARHGKIPKKLSAKVQVKRKAKVASKKAVTHEPNLTPIKCPAWFDEYAREEWERVCQVLFDKGTLGDVNHATLEGYCAAYSRAVRAEIELRDGFDREVTMYAKGGAEFTVLKKKSECAVAERAWGQVKMFAVELGITAGSADTGGEKLTPLEKALAEAERKPR